MGERYVTLGEVKELMEKAQEERELTMEQKFVLNHANSFSRINKEDAEELIEKLMELEHIHERLAFKITDLMPETDEEVKALFAKERAVIGKKDIEQILELCSEYL